jgi:hypothetical protein
MKKRGLVLPPPPQSPTKFLHSSLPPPTPPEGGKWGRSCLHSIILHAADSAPHAENTHFSRQIGVRAGHIYRLKIFLFGFRHMTTVFIYITL